MSRERELLKRLLENFERPVTGRFGDLFDEVRELLSTPEPTQDEEPVAWVSGVRDLLSWDKLYDDMSPLYFHSKQKTQNEKRMDAILALCGKSAPRPEWLDLTEDEAHAVFKKWGRQRKLPPDLYGYCLFLSAALKKKNCSTIPSLNNTISANSRDSGHE